MRFGINTFLFTSPFTNESTKFFRNFKAWGFDSVEIAVEHESHIDPAFVKSELDRQGLVCGTLCGAFSPGRDLRGTEEEQRACIDYVQKLIDIAVVLDSPALVGPVYSAVGRINRLCARCSIMCADQPDVRAMTKMGACVGLHLHSGIPVITLVGEWA